MALLVHGSVQIQLDTAKQAVAEIVGVGRRITMCAIYFAGPYNLTMELMCQLYEHLPTPVLMTEDFNAHNALWVCRETKLRGRMLETLAISSGVIYLITET